jgi:hypothetical protein
MTAEAGRMSRRLPTHAVIEPSNNSEVFRYYRHADVQRFTADGLEPPCRENRRQSNCLEAEMNLTSEEFGLVEILRECCADGGRLHFTASCKNGVWECELQNIYDREVVVCRGVGNSFVEAFARLDGNDVEPVEDDDV